LKPRLRGWNTSAEIDDLYQRSRDYEKDGDTIIKLLELDSNSMVIDMGAGTGTFELHAAKHCRISLRGGRIFHHTELLPEKRRRERGFKRSVLRRRLFDVRARGRARGCDGLDSCPASSAGFPEIGRSYDRGIDPTFAPMLRIS